MLIARAADTRDPVELPTITMLIFRTSSGVACAGTERRLIAVTRNR